jgi:hypothetical protein
MRDEIKAADTRRQLCKYGAGFLEQLETPRSPSASSPRPRTPRHTSLVRPATAGAMQRSGTDGGSLPLGSHGGAYPQPPATARPEYNRQRPPDVAPGQPLETNHAATDSQGKCASARGENHIAISPCSTPTAARVSSRLSRFSMGRYPPGSAPAAHLEWVVHAHPALPMPPRRANAEQPLPIRHGVGRRQRSLIA